MSDRHLSPYTGRIIGVSGADHREALIVETALRWGFGNSGTLDHLDAGDFDQQVREVVRMLAAPALRARGEREAGRGGTPDPARPETGPRPEGR